MVANNSGLTTEHLLEMQAELSADLLSFAISRRALMRKRFAAS